MKLLYKDTNQIIFNYLTLDDKYAFHKYSEKYDNDNLEFTQEVILTIKNMKKSKWAKICYTNSINFFFIDNHIEKIKWNVISRYPKINKDLIERYSNRLDWGQISIEQTFDVQFIRKHIDKIHWSNLSWNKKTLNEDIIREFQFELDWNGLSECYDFTADLLIEFNHKINHDLRDMYLHY